MNHDNTAEDARLGQLLAESASQAYGPEPTTQRCAFCASSYASDGLRPRAVCADCWPQVRSIERAAARDARCGTVAA